MQFDLSNKQQQDTNHLFWLSLDKTQRINLHPLFRSIEEYHCNVFYNPKLKCFLVEYGLNSDNMKYEKGILSRSISNIVDDVLNYYSSI
jgi:hypothetical protein